MGAGVAKMHEFSMCQTIVSAVAAELAKMNPPPKRLVKVRVVVGRLRNVVPEFMQDAFKILSKDTPVAGAELEIRLAPVIGKCEKCSSQGEMPRGVFVCGKCGSAKAEIVCGRELYLDDLEVEIEDGEQVGKGA